jgi:hypothetical protein
MTPRPRRLAALAASLVVFWATTSAGSAGEKVPLDRAVIVTEPDQPSFVQYAVDDLAGYLKELTGREAPVGTSSDGKARVLIVIGPKAAERALARAFPVEGLGNEGYRLRSVSQGGTDFVIAAGATPRGTKAAVVALGKMIQADGRSAFVPAPLDLVGKPAFAKRGIHFNGWAFHYPYTFRGWREKDWQHYLDVLSYQHVNLFYLWPFMEIMPVPLSKEDAEYLEECRRIVDYAQKKHGMEVWIMQCTNRVAKDRCGVADPRRRPYWRPSQEDLNPGNPQHYRAIMESREALYRIVNNVDGVCNIDSDPGYCAGSPISDYLKVLQGCRALLDRHNVHGRQAKLVNWMWFGWGLPPQRSFEPAHQALTIRGLRQDLPEPWGLVSGRFEFLGLCREQGVLAKTVVLPYGIIEGEPSYPTTNVQIDAIRAAFEDHIAKYPELGGVMGNVQTPLLQFPNVYFYTSATWDAQYRKRSEREVLLDLARLLYPEHAPLIADCYLALKAADVPRMGALAGQLGDLVEQDRLGRPGLFGRKLFPDHRIVARILVLQLRLRAAQEALVQTLGPAAGKAECVNLVRDYFDAYLAWDTAHGWHSLWGWSSWPLGTFASDARFPTVAAKLRAALGNEQGVEAAFGQIASALSNRYGETPVKDGCITPLKTAVLSAIPVRTLAQQARATASVVPDPARYPAGAANDGLLSTLYWPGALVKNNTEWLQLTWNAPQTFDKVIVRFLQHPSMHGRTIHLQKETSPGKWEDLATAAIPNDAAAPHAVAAFRLPARATLDKIRVVNLLDVFEIEVR